MRIMIDTNVLISMIFFPNEHMNKLKILLCKKHSIVLCSYVVEELQKVTARKFSSKAEEMNRFLETLPFQMVYTPKLIDYSKFPMVRDNMDIPILVTAILQNVDLLLTGDNDFSDLEIERPKIMTPSAFLEHFV